MPWYLRLLMFCRRKALDTHDLNPAQRISSQDRRARALPLLRAVDQTVGITAPTLVIHGDEDPFFPHRNGVVLAAEIPGATLLTLSGIGQGVPRVTWPAVVDALLRHTS